MSGIVHKNASSEVCDFAACKTSAHSNRWSCI